MSIDTQKKKLTDFAKRNGIAIGDIYVDDGITGVTFEREDFKRMMSDIDNEKINCVIVKDLSRLGRDDAMSNYYYEDVFIRDNIRFISIDDNVDTKKGYENIVPFMNMFNAMYPRTISQKTRSALKTKAQHGEFLGSKAPFGYFKDPTDKHKLIIDERAAEVVREIFDLAIMGHGFAKIAKMLRSKKILNPSAYCNEITPRHYKSGYWRDNPHDWHVTSIKLILENETYLGHTVQGKRTKVSHKTKDMVKVPKEKWIRVENTHKPIIDKDIWDKAHQIIASRKRQLTNGTVQIFAGLLKCSDCGSAVTFVRKGKNNSYTCSLYRAKGKNYCQIHYISYNDLYNIVLDDIKAHIALLKKSEKKLYDVALNLNRDKKRRDTKSWMEQKQKADKRIMELDTIIKRLYEDNILGKITDKRFAVLSNEYEKEQTELKDKMVDIAAKLAEYDKAEGNAEKFVDMFRKHIDIQELTAPILNELIQKIVIGNKVWVNGKQEQEIQIHYNFMVK